MSPSEYLSLPSELTIKEKLVVKSASSPDSLSQRRISREYLARPHLSDSSGVRRMTEREKVAFPFNVISSLVVLEKSEKLKDN